MSIWVCCLSLDPHELAHSGIVFTLKQESLSLAPVTSDYIGDIFLGCYMQKVPPPPPLGALFFQ